MYGSIGRSNRALWGSQKPQRITTQPNHFNEPFKSDTGRGSSCPARAACGCGNFLIIAYRELRTLEIDVLRGSGFCCLRALTNTGFRYSARSAGTMPSTRFRHIRFDFFHIPPPLFEVVPVVWTI